MLKHLLKRTLDYNPSMIIMEKFQKEMVVMRTQNQYTDVVRINIQST